MPRLIAIAALLLLAGCAHYHVPMVCSAMPDLGPGVIVCVDADELRAQK